MDNIKKISKLLSLVLRHKPEKAGIIIDQNGWTDVKTLLKNINTKFFELSFEQLKKAVDTNDKKRYSFNKSFTKIRANQGHSIPVDLELKPMVPPEFLYHGTPCRFVSSIFKEGIKKQSRQYVHLSSDIKTAKKVGNRRGKSTILKIAALQMHFAGFEFYISENMVWLTDYVDPKYIEIINDHH